MKHTKLPFTHYLSETYNRSCFLDHVTPGDIITIIIHMKSKKITGCDRISSRFLKTIRGEITCTYPLSVVINNYLCTGTVPDSMPIAKAITVYKAKDRQNMSIIDPYHF